MESASEQCLADRVSRLESSVEALKGKLVRSAHRLSKAARRLKSSRLRNEDLRLQVETLNSKVNHICQHMQKPPCLDSAVQTDDLETSMTPAHAPDVSVVGQACEHSTNLCSAEIAVPEELLPQPQYAEPSSVAEALRTAAEEAVRQCGMVYDEASGYYYDQSTDLYYHPESQLYFDQKNCAYYYFDQTTQKYVFHSQLESSQLEMYSKVVKSRNSRRLQKRKQARLQHGSSATDNDEKGCAGYASGSCTDDARGSSRRELSADREDGELSDSSGSDSAEHHSCSASSVPRSRRAHAESSEAGTLTTAVPSGWPPCIRAIVLKSQVLRPGALHIITYPGGSVGLDKDMGHALVLPDVTVSKIHAQITYDQVEKGFFIQDLGSTNGTFVNGHKLVTCEMLTRLTLASAPKPVESVAVDVTVAAAGSAGGGAAPSATSETAVPADAAAPAAQGAVVVGAGSRHSPSRLRLSHRDIVRFATCELLVHIHPSTDTCSECEPGVTLHRASGGGADSTAPGSSADALVETVVSGSKTSVEARRRMLMKKIKQKYGLEKEAFQQPKSNRSANNYMDRAHLRRQLVGSDNPHVLDREPVASSVDRAISPDNKGHKLLKKMGWKSGNALGRSGRDGGSGLVEPVKATIRLNAAAGLGADTAIHASLDDAGLARVLSSKAHVRKKTRERFEQIK